MDFLKIFANFVIGSSSGQVGKWGDIRRKRFTLSDVG
jgi:hypothetical protein